METQREMAIFLKKALHFSDTQDMAVNGNNVERDKMPQPIPSVYIAVLFDLFTNCRIHHVPASMTTIDLIIKPRTERFGAGDYTF